MTAKENTKLPSEAQQGVTCNQPYSKAQQSKLDWDRNPAAMVSYIDTELAIFVVSITITNHRIKKYIENYVPDHFAHWEVSFFNVSNEFTCWEVDLVHIIYGCCPFRNCWNRDPVINGLEHLLDPSVCIN